MKTRAKNSGARLATKVVGSKVGSVAATGGGGSPTGLQFMSSAVLTQEETKIAKALAHAYVASPLQLPLAGLLEAFTSATEPALDRIRVGFDGSQTVYEWGAWRQRVNQNPYQYYLRQQQPDTPVIVHGIDPAFASQATRWGRVVLSLTALEYSSRFGGCFHLRLTPEEDYGIELVGDASGGVSRIYVDLKKWLVHVWVQPTKQLFNQPVTVGSLRVYTELEVTEYEVYEQPPGGGFAPHPSPAPDAVASLLSTAATDAHARLLLLARFALGYAHEHEISSFDSVSDSVEEIFLSDGICAFQTRTKTPHVQVRMKASYLGTGSLEGPFDDDAELTAEPWLILRDPQNVISSVSKTKYIGSGSSTGFLTFDYLSLDEAARVKEVTAFASWTEDDPVSDDSGSSNGFVFIMSFDRAQLEADANANNLGQIGSILYGLMEDSFEDWLSYAVEIEFILVKL